MSTPHSNNSPHSEVFDAHLDAIGALAWKPFETAKRLPQMRTEQKLGPGYANKRRPIGSRQGQEAFAEHPVGPGYPPRDVDGTGGGHRIQGVGQQTFADEIQRRGVEHRRVAQGARGRPPRNQPAQLSDLYHRESHQRPFVENVHTMEPGTAVRQQHSDWVQARNDRYRQEQDHYAPARPGQGHGQYSHGWVPGFPRDVYPQGPNNYPHTHPHPQFYAIQALNAEGPWLPNADHRGGTHYAWDRQQRRRVGYKGRGEY